MPAKISRRRGGDFEKSLTEKKQRKEVKKQGKTKFKEYLKRGKSEKN
jgi:hypothetical protein